MPAVSAKNLSFTAQLGYSYPPIPDLQNTPDLSSLVTVFLRLTRPGLSLVNGMLLADEANNDFGFWSLSVMDVRKKPLSEEQHNQPDLK